MATGFRVNRRSTFWDYGAVVDSTEHYAYTLGSFTYSPNTDQKFYLSTEIGTGFSLHAIVTKTSDGTSPHVVTGVDTTGAYVRAWSGTSSASIVVIGA